MAELGGTGEPLPHQQGSLEYTVLGQELGRDQGISDLGLGTQEPGEPFYVCFWGGGDQYSCDLAGSGALAGTGWLAG